MTLNNQNSELQACINLLTKAQLDYLDERKILSEKAQIDGSLGPVIRSGIGGR